MHAVKSERLDQGSQHFRRLPGIRCARPRRAKSHLASGHRVSRYGATDTLPFAERYRLSGKRRRAFRNGANLTFCQTDLIQSDGYTCGECSRLRIARLRFIG